MEHYASLSLREERERDSEIERIEGDSVMLNVGWEDKGIGAVEGRGGGCGRA